MKAADDMIEAIGRVGLLPNYMHSIEEPTAPINSTQIGGNHYTKLAIQPWDYLQSILGPEGFEAYLAGNVIKYISRYKLKNGVQDLQKAQHYLAKLIETLSL